MINVHYRTYATKDAALAIACVSPGIQRTPMKAVGMEDAALATPIGDREAQLRHYRTLGARMEALMVTRTTAEWKAFFDSHGIPASGVMLPLELLDDEQVVANGFARDLAHPVLGPVRVLATPLRLDGEGFQPGPATAPFGSQTRTLLGDLGFSDAEVAALLAEGVTRDDKPSLPTRGAP
jgi:crotonobetainyl-CoA:carnitine CoA-transferase CaiB-like acyl-CoA transferase